jgi:hypothetical protein
LLWSNLHRLCLPTAIVVPVIVQELGIDLCPFGDIIPQKAVGLTEFKFRSDPKKASPNARRHFDGKSIMVRLPVKLRALENVGGLNQHIKFVHLKTPKDFNHRYNYHSVRSAVRHNQLFVYFVISGFWVNLEYNAQRIFWALYSEFVIK